jgi:hypothetical protein
MDPSITKDAELIKINLNFNLFHKIICTVESYFKMWQIAKNIYFQGNKVAGDDDVILCRDVL